MSEFTNTVSASESARPQTPYGGRAHISALRKYVGKFLNQENI